MEPTTIKTNIPVLVNNDYMMSIGAATIYVDENEPTVAIQILLQPPHAEAVVELMKENNVAMAFVYKKAEPTNG